jgi:hypothetical protein
LDIPVAARANLARIKFIQSDREYRRPSPTPVSRPTGGANSLDAAVAGVGHEPGTVARTNRYQYRKLPAAFQRTANRVLAIWGDGEVYDSALGFLSFVFRIHGVQPDAPTG